MDVWHIPYIPPAQSLLIAAIKKRCRLCWETSSLARIASDCNYAAVRQ